VGFGLTGFTGVPSQIPSFVGTSTSELELVAE
jgi:hypothetical protein